MSVKFKESTQWYKYFYVATAIATAMSLDKARTRTARSRGVSTNHEASPPPPLGWCRWRDFARECFCFCGDWFATREENFLEFFSYERTKWLICRQKEISQPRMLSFRPITLATTSSNSCLEARHSNSEP